KAMKGVEAVYHLAGLVSWDRNRGPEMYDLHVQCTKVVLEEALAAGVKRFILASTSGAIGVSKTDRVATEEDDYPIEVVGKWPYYLSKIYEEKLTLKFCREKGLPLVILNPSLLLGPGDDRLSSTREVLLFMTSDIPSMPTGGLSFVDVRDAAQAFVAALEKGLLYERHLLGGANMSFREYFGRLSRLTGVAPPKLKLPSRLNILGAYALDRWHRSQGSETPLHPQAVEMGEHFFYIDSARAQRELGFSPRDPQETLLDTVRYLQQTIPGLKRVV
ncbi:MAG: NAD-dependent epimerase/dehydratase family protein, partial [Myxococcales bacterium]